MKYIIEYHIPGGSPPVEFDINELKQKMINHIELLDNSLGKNNWAYTGSSALAIYASKYKPYDLSKISKPNDLDVIFVDNKHLNEFSFQNIGDYKRPNKDAVKSASFTNTITNEKLDVLVERRMKKIDIDNIPLIDINIIHYRYNDPLYKRVDDDNKAGVLKSIIDDNVITEPVISVPEVSKVSIPEKNSNSGNLMSQFSESDDEIQIPRVSRQLTFDD